MQKKEKLYEGKAKILFATENPDILWLEYKNSLTAFNGEKKETLEGKGRLTNLISSEIFTRLASKGIRTHFIEKISDTEQFVTKTEIIPLEVIVRNITAGSICKRLGVAEKMKLPRPLVEFCYKDDALGDPFIAEDHALIFNWAKKDEIENIKAQTLKINESLKEIFSQIGITLVDFKLEFGKTSAGEIMLSDEISPDTCRFWNAETMEKLDKDRFRENLGNVLFAYEEIFRRLTN